MTGAEERTRAHLTIDGRVQGVWFRGATREAAERLGVTGWVRNLPDGRVEAVLEGEPARVEEMIQWCRQGPPAARVDEISVTPEPWQGEFEHFTIRR